MRLPFFSIIFLALLACSCSSKHKPIPAKPTDVSQDVLTDSDSVHYGLVCDGQTDTILVFLPINDISSDPDTFNILKAVKERRLYGRMKIGDKVAVVLNDKDSTVADMVINMNDLFQTWCYQVMPTLHHRADMEGKTEKQAIANMPDSLRQLLSTPLEYTMVINSDNSVVCHGDRRMMQDEGNKFMNYPKVKHYRQWNLMKEGKLLLKEIALDTLGNQQLVGIDTASFVLLRKDTLVLCCNGKLCHFYAKKKE